MPRLNRREKKNGSRYKTHPGQSYRVYCPECPPKDFVHPERNVHVTLSGGERAVTCRNGHTIHVGGQSVCQSSPAPVQEQIL